MRRWLVDTNVLIDLIGADVRFGVPARETLAECAADGVLVVNQIILSEVAAFLTSLEEMDRLLPQELFVRENIPWEATFLAGQAFRRHRERGGRRGRILADFLIGAHAAVGGLTLVTRDRDFQRWYDIEILDPVRGSR
jgi:predicted nucleic acid-binding protein